VNPHLPAASDEPIPVDAVSGRAAMRRLRGTDVSSAIYGTLLVTVLVAAQARADADVRLVGLVIAVGVLVFWLTDVWAGIVGLGVRGPLSRERVIEVAREESPMLLAALPPILALAVAPLGWATVDAALNLALAVAVIQLFLWGLAVGFATGRGWGIALLVGLVDLVLGLVIVGLKLAVIH
jgi:hypothetical protein